jgi:hypothetical protein
MRRFAMPDGEEEGLERDARAHVMEMGWVMGRAFST